MGFLERNMKKILLILSLVFSNFYFADHAISTNCHNAKEDFTALKNFSGTPLGNTPIALGAASFTLVGTYAAAYNVYNSYINSSAAPVTMMESERLCFQDMNTSIESNISNISSNTTNISSNSLIISSIQLDNLIQFTKLSSGVASSIAMSNVDYADEGWSMGVGAGNFNSETEYAFGLSFASENTSFKIATSKNSSALGINYKFKR